MFELLLQMDKRACSLDQAFEILRVFRRDRIVEPDLFEDIVRFVITLFVPALKKRAVIRMSGDRRAAGFRRVRFQ